VSPKSGEPEIRTRVRAGDHDRSYDVLVQPGALKRLDTLLARHAPAHRYVFVSDERVARLHTERLVDGCVEAGLAAVLLSFPEGEVSKTRETWARLTDRMLAAGCGRDTTVVAVGGGVSTDLAGFVAATFMRGVPLVQVPTSYLAMIDASVGGKTGVDVPSGKNLVVAFHPPELVVVDPEVLATLSTTERAEGLVEAFKHGALVDRAYFERLARDCAPLLEADPHVALSAVARSVEIKAEIVSADEREAGYRQVLNLGHTLGHALEAASDYHLRHGTAVAQGMVLEAEIGERLGVTEAGTARRLRDVLALLGLDMDPGERWTHVVPQPLLDEVLAERVSGNRSR